MNFGYLVLLLLQKLLLLLLVPGWENTVAVKDGGEKQPFSTASVACGCCSKTASKKSPAGGKTPCL